MMSLDWCGVAVNTLAASTNKEAIFQACSLAKTGGNRYNKMMHKDEPGNRRRRLKIDNPIGVYGIECPTSSVAVAQTTVFSAPIFKISKFPARLRGMGRH